MAKTALNKSALHKAKEELKLYKRVLPSLDLKRRQLTIEASKARKERAEAEAEVRLHTERIGERIPMLANPAIQLKGLVEIDRVEVAEENVVGIRVPVLVTVHCTVRDYSLLAKPHWVDILVDELKAAVEARARLDIAEKRVEILDAAVRRATQRVNLFEKIRIPETEQLIQRIRIFLGDAERAAIVRSKIAKAKQRKLMLEAAEAES